MNKGWSESIGNNVQEAVQFAGDSIYGWVHQFHEWITEDGRFPFYTIAALLLCSIVRILSESSDYNETGARQVAFMQTDAIAGHEIL